MTEMNWHPHQILCLDHENTSLYGELIQIIPKRGLCWLRPLALVQCSQPNQEIVKSLYDLRQGADLLYPKFLFRTALDTEVLPLLTQLENLKVECSTSATPVSQVAHQQLQAFVYKIWQTHPEAFDYLKCQKSVELLSEKDTE